MDILQLFKTGRLGLCDNFKYYITHALYGCQFSKISYVTIVLAQLKYYLVAENDTTVFSWSYS